MNDDNLPRKAVLALEALKAQSVITPAYADHNGHYKALKGLAENEPWTSRIIRAAKSDESINVAADRKLTQ